MPVNEILAPYYLRVTYTTWAAKHNLTLYLPTGTIVQTSGVFTHSALVENALNPSGNISDFVRILFQLVYQNRSILSPSVDAIELWQSQNGPNALVGYSTPVQPTGGTIQGVAASYAMLAGTAIAGSTRQRWRLTFFEAISSANPQRYSGNALELSTNSDIWQYVLGAMVSQDGLSPLIPRSTNVGYNRRLAVAYGRILTP